MTSLQDRQICRQKGGLCTSHEAYVDYASVHRQAVQALFQVRSSYAVQNYIHTLPLQRHPELMVLASLPD